MWERRLCWRYAWEHDGVGTHEMGYVPVCHSVFGLCRRSNLEEYVVLGQMRH